jgi:hypothetical protein
MPSATLPVPRQAQADEAEEHREQGNGRDRGEDGHTIPMTSAGPARGRLALECLAAESDVNVER